MRLFIALWPDNESATQLSRLASMAHKSCGGRVMWQHNLHLTIAFLGRVNKHLHTRLVNDFANWYVPESVFTLNTIGYFERPRVVWAGVSNPLERRHLTDIYDNMWDRLKSYGFRPEERPFEPHISLLRNAEYNNFSRVKMESIVCRPKRCFLVASNPTPNKTNYEVLSELSVQGV